MKRGHDGRLEVHEVFGIDLNASLVVLSACETALGAGYLSEVPAGDDWIGLVRAFLSAGSSNVMATLWLVEDEPTAELIVGFYRRLSMRRDPVAALAEAQRAAIADPNRSHPYYWAGFALVGRG